MDYNDFSARLRKTLASLNARFDDEIAIFADHTETETINPDNTRTIVYRTSYRFGNDDFDTIINKIFIILYNLSSLKDHLKNVMKKKGINEQEVEDVINNSLHLQVLIDIVNQEKHGSPLRRTNRSNKNPKIVDAKQSLIVSTIATPETPNPQSRIYLTQKGMEIVGDSKNQMAIVAKIEDGEKNFLFSLDELLETSYSKFLEIAERHNCC